MITLHAGAGPVSDPGAQLCETERREMLLEQLGARFGTLAEAVEARVRAADAAQLKRWLLRFATAPTLAEVLADG